MGRPLLPETQLELFKIDHNVASDSVLKSRRALIEALIAEYNALVLWRAKVRDLNAKVAA